MEPNSRRIVEPGLKTDRLLVRLGRESDVPEIVDYFTRNTEHLSTTDPGRPEGFLTEEYWRKQLRKNLEGFEAGLSARTFLFLKAHPERVAGAANLN